MQKERTNIYKQSFEDQTINPLQLFKVSTNRSTNIHKSQHLDDHMCNLSSNASNPYSKTENNLIPRYKTLTQHSMTEQSMDDQNPISQINDRSCSINLDTERRKKGTFKCQLTKKRKQRNPQLKQIIHRQKISNIVRNFIYKLKRNNIFAPIVQVQTLEDQQQSLSWFNLQGIDINQSLHRAFDIILLSINFISIYFYTLRLAFNIDQLPWAIEFERWVLVAFIADFTLNSLTNKCIAGKKITKLKEIVKWYMGESLIVDLLMIIMLIVELFDKELFPSYFKLLIIFKMPYLFQKMQKIQIHFISTTYKEQYWSLVKLFLFNFCFAHILALILRSVANIDPSQNWMIVKEIAYAPWYQIYIWSYYWAINIMLTVGFGDMVATNYQQALCLIFIQTFSCMALAYNINCVGSLISNIRSQDLEKSKKYKIFRGLAQKHEISDQLFMRIGNYIEESNNIKKKFNIQQENKFIDTLPKIFKKDYLKQANKSIFLKIFFFTNLADKAVQSLAESIEVNITHPEQLITNVENYMSLRILKEGSMGYCCKKLGSRYNGHVIDQIAVRQGESPFLLGVEFITHRRPNFEIKSMQYSVIYGLTYDRLIQSLKKSRGDYEYLCFLRDKSKYLIDQFQINKCKHCKTKHTKFLCPKLHFIPIKQQIIFRSLYNEKISRCNRTQMQRIKFKNYNPLRHFQSINQIPLATNISCSTFSKNQEFIIRQLRNIERINTEMTTHQRTIFDFPMVFLNNTAQSIKQELSHFLRRQNEEDEIWTIALDSMQNYKNYFPNDNPGEIENRFRYQQKTVFVPLGQNSKNPFILYPHHKEKTLKEGTYIERLQRALDSQSNHLSQPYSTFQNC